MIELLIILYIILFCLGLQTDLKISIEKKDKYYMFSIPLTAPIIGAKLITDKITQVIQKCQK